MQRLAGTVGDGGANALQDVVLVQAILVVSSRPAKVDSRTPKYLKSYDGVCGMHTIAALRQFQDDQVFVNSAGNASQAVAGARSGLVAPDDPTWKKLCVAPPEAMRDLRAIAGSKVVYASAPASELQVNLAALNSAEFESSFRMKVVNLFNRMHADYGTAISVSADGARRTFQKQYELLTNGQNVTHAGPGESNHNYGQAADLGFKGLRWLKQDGAVITNETSWFHKMDAYGPFAGQSLKFWNLLRSNGQMVGLFHGPLSDRPHLQAWNDAGISMGARLANLLSKSGAMQWSSAIEANKLKYLCDLSVGGTKYNVGTAAEVWSLNATVTAANLAQATGKPIATIKPQDIADMRQRLRADFQAADANWRSWTAY